jgi:hypothetical protein
MKDCLNNLIRYKHFRVYSFRKYLIKSTVATLIIKRIPDNEIICEIDKQTNKTITKRFLYYVKKQIKRESFKWYKTMREGEFEYIHEFKERTNEIM